jgi:hypothetical protein
MLGIAVVLADGNGSRQMHARPNLAEVGRERKHAWRATSGGKEIIRAAPGTFESRRIS